MGRSEFVDEERKEELGHGRAGGQGFSQGLCQHVRRDAIGVVGRRGKGDGEVAGSDIEDSFDEGVSGLGEGGLGTADDFEEEDKATWVLLAFTTINQTADKVCLHL